MMDIDVYRQQQSAVAEMKEQDKIKQEITETNTGLRCCGEPTSYISKTDYGVELRQCMRCMRYIRIENNLKGKG